MLDMAYKPLYTNTVHYDHQTGNIIEQGLNFDGNSFTGNSADFDEIVTDSIDATEMVVDTVETDSVVTLAITTEVINGVDGQIDVTDSMIFDDNEGVQFGDGILLDTYDSGTLNGSWTTCFDPPVSADISYVIIGTIVHLRLSAFTGTTVAGLQPCNYSLQLPVGTRPSTKVSCPIMNFFGSDGVDPINGPAVLQIDVDGSMRIYIYNGNTNILTNINGPASTGIGAAATGGANVSFII